MSTTRPTEENERRDTGTFALTLDVEEARQELALVEPEAIARDDDVDPELDAQADAQVRRLMAIDLDDQDQRTGAASAVEEMGGDLQRKAAQQSRMLQQPIRDLARHSDDGGPVAQAIVDLKMEVEELDPGKVDFEAGWLSRLVGRVPGVGTPLKRYFTKFESAQTVLEAIDRSLRDGAEMLRRDNATLADDQKQMRALTTALERQIALGRILDRKLGVRMERELGHEDARRAFLETELLFPLRQRVMDLQQQLAVNQQGVLAIEIIVRNNRELIRGVTRARNVTMSALQVAVTVALALQNQKIVLDRITALNQTTSSLIAGTAAQLRSQGTAIHRQATEASVDMETLKAAFQDINEAIAEIGTYRRNALPQMAESIETLETMTAEGEEAIRRMEAGRRSQAMFGGGDETAAATRDAT